MLLFDKNKKKRRNLYDEPWRITRACLDLILESSKDVYPREFGALLRSNRHDSKIIEEIVLLPGTVSGDSHAIFKMYMKPVDFTIVGTVHSHPSYSFHPSEADLFFFQKNGRVHIIVAKPYDYSSWAGYDSSGQNIDIKII